MDWTKSKNILIVALLVTNFIIASAYYGEIREASKEQLAAAESTQSFLEQKGIVLDTQIPSRILKKPVLFVRFSPTEAGEENEPVYYDGMLVEASQAKETSIVPLSYGETKRDIVSASYALLKVISNIEEEKLAQLHITQIELIYLVDTSEFQQDISEDTAVPAWKITTADQQIFYVNAYGE